jgi:hypothetical protein
MRKLITEEIAAAMAKFKPQSESCKEIIPSIQRDEASNNYKPVER